MNKDKFTFEIAQIKTYKIYNLLKHLKLMTTKITYLKKASSRSQSSLVLFIDEKININNLKNHLSVNEFTYIKDFKKLVIQKKIFLFTKLTPKKK